MAELTIGIVDADGDPRELLLLRDWLAAEPDIRGRIRTVDRPVEEGHLGPVLDVLLLALGPSGVATAATSALIAWIKHQRSDLTVKATRGDGSSIELTSKRVKGLDHNDLSQLLGRLEDFLEGATVRPEGETRARSLPTGSQSEGQAGG